MRVPVNDHVFYTFTMIAYNKQWGTYLIALVGEPIKLPLPNVTLGENYAFGSYLNLWRVQKARVLCRITSLLENIKKKNASHRRKSA